MDAKVTHVHILQISPTYPTVVFLCPWIGCRSSHASVLFKVRLGFQPRSFWQSGTPMVLMEKCFLFLAVVVRLQGSSCRYLPIFIGGE
ncbi:unnamed protein product [Cylicostephanus goldi]|uniref:Uncharacterized protein n=1 Tax=Cylicostephanus goldi TaxID=71465 RepID=A0A3P7N0E4_CYLGO|nr:unnamed protein product [Cylicostephanus goldi]